MSEEEYEVFTLSNGEKIKVKKSIIRKIITTKLSPNPYYMYSGYISPIDVARFFNGDEDPELLQRINDYILFYAENIVFSTYLHMKSSASNPNVYDRGRNKGYQYLREIYPFIKELRKLHYINAHPKRLLNLCLKYAIDPF